MKANDRFSPIILVICCAVQAGPKYKDSQSIHNFLSVSTQIKAVQLSCGSLCFVTYTAYAGLDN